jgi:hypothetical protein
MASSYFQLSPEERQEALGVASTQSGRAAHLLEKDVWVVWTLQQLFDSPDKGHLVFKGGTSLSKAYKVIDRFSEDIDITFDIRTIAPDLVAEFPNALPVPRSQQKKWTDIIRERLSDWVAGKMLPFIQARVVQADAKAKAVAEGEAIIIRYKPLVTGTGYVGPQIKIEFGARSTGEPPEPHQIVTDAAAVLSEISFAECTVRVMRAERTFWEKATAINVFCKQGKFDSERFARHWYDVAQLDDHGVVNRALTEQDLAQAVAQHKSIFFRENDADKNLIDYTEAVNGNLRLVPEGEARTALAADYKKMADDGLLPEGAKSFDEILKQCADVEKRAAASALKK